MSYTLYRNVRVLSIGQQEQTRIRRPKEIADPTYERGSYFVTVARFSNVNYDATISAFRELIREGQEVSVAIDEEFWNVIAVVNHTTWKSAGLRYDKIKFSDIWGTLFYMAIPGVLCFFIARKAFQTTKYHDMGYIILGAGAAIILFILLGVNKQYRQSRAA